MNGKRIILLFLYLFLAANLCAAKDGDNQSPGTAQQRIEGLLEELGPLKESKEKVDTLNNLADAYLEIDPAKTMAYAKQGAELGEKLNYPEGAAEGYFLTGLGYYVKGDYHRALESYEKSKGIAEKAGDRKGVARCINNIATLHDRQGKVKEALDGYSKSLAIRKEIGDEKGIAESLSNIGTVYKARGDYKRALEYYAESLKLEKKLDNNRGIARLYNNTANILALQGKTREAKEYYSRSLKLYQQMGEKLSTARAYMNLGNLYFIKGDNDRSLEYLFRSQEVLREMDYKKGVAAGYNNIGSVLRVKGDLSQALEYFLKSLVIREELGDKDGIATSCNNIGNIYFDREQYQRAVEYYSRALKINKEIDSKMGIALIYNNLGNTYNAMGKIEEALSHFNRSLKLGRQLEDKSSLAYNHKNIGVIYLKRKEYNRALDSFLKSAELFGDIGEKEGLAEALTGVGMAYRGKGENKKALDFMTRGLNTATEIDALSSINLATGELSRLYAQLGQYKQAYKYSLLFKEKSDALLNEGTVQKMTQLEMQYQFDKKQKQQALEQKKKELVQETEIKKQRFLRHIYFSAFLFMFILAVVIYRGFRMKKRTNRILAKQQDEIVKQSIELELANRGLHELNATKDKFFSIIAHDLKNPFSSLLGLLAMLVSEYDNLDKEEIKELLESLHKSSGITYALLENLLHWSRSQTGKYQMNPRILVLREAVENSFQLLKHHAESKGIRLENGIGEEVSVYADEHMLQTVFRNIISNAVKFTPRGGLVRAMAQKCNGMVEAEVRDTGVGIDEENIDKLFRIDTHHVGRGTADEQGTGLGLILCKEFVRKNGGDIKVQSERGKGSAFIFSFPAAAGMEHVSGV